MNLNENDIANLAAYWEGSLSEIEARELEHRLNTDTAFAKTALQVKATLAAVNAARRKHTKEYLRSLENNLPMSTAAESKVKLLWVKITVAALLLLALSWWLWKGHSTKGKQMEAIAMELFEPYPPARNTRSGMADEAISAYADGDYKLAIPLLEKVLASNNQDSLALFYLGVAHLGLRNGQNAVTIFESLLRTPNIPKEATRWYLALAYVQIDERGKALHLLEQVSDFGKYQQRGEDLKKAILEEK